MTGADEIGDATAVPALCLWFVPNGFATNAGPE
jgi:hypothetical protein